MTLTNSRGETLVEVTLATAILALVMVVSYAAANASVQTSILARERLQAIHIAQQQADKLRVSRDAQLGQAGGNILTVGTCTSSGTTCSFNYGGNLNANVASGKVDCDPAMFPTDLHCTYKITLNSLTADQASYTVYVQWDSTRGSASPNTTSLDVVLVDKRNMQLIDCTNADQCPF